jgi:hypothetical protein
LGDHPRTGTFFILRLGHADAEISGLFSVSPNASVYNEGCSASQNFVLPQKRVGHLKKVGSAAAHNPDILARTIHVLAFGSPALLMRLGATSLQSSASGTPIPITTSNRALANSGMAGQLKRLVNGLVAGGHCHRLWHSVLGGN